MTKRMAMQPHLQRSMVTKSKMLTRYPILAGSNSESIENPFVVFKTPEGNEFQILKNWFNDHHSAVIGEVHRSTANTPDDTANNARGATHPSALCLSTNINAIQY
ncbi:hypothetical protein MRX96_014660 [Rhipicephalus microplus]